MMRVHVESGPGDWTALWSDTPDTDALLEFANYLWGHRFMLRTTDQYGGPYEAVAEADGGYVVSMRTANLWFDHGQDRWSDV